MHKKFSCNSAQMFGDPHIASEPQSGLKFTYIWTQGLKIPN